MSLATLPENVCFLVLKAVVATAIPTGPPFTLAPARNTGRHAMKALLTTASISQRFQDSYRSYENQLLQAALEVDEPWLTTPFIRTYYGALKDLPDAPVDLRAYPTPVELVKSRSLFSIHKQVFDFACFTFKLNIRRTGAHRRPNYLSTSLLLFLPTTYEPPIKPTSPYWLLAVYALAFGPTLPAQTLFEALPVPIKGPAPYNPRMLAHVDMALWASLEYGFDQIRGYGQPPASLREFAEFFGVGVEGGMTDWTVGDDGAVQAWTVNRAQAAPGLVEGWKGRRAEEEAAREAMRAGVEEEA